MAKEDELKQEDEQEPNEIDEAMSWVGPIQDISKAASKAAAAAEVKTQQWLPALARAGATAMIAASGLPVASREHLSARMYANPSEVEMAIKAEREYLAKLSQENVIQIGGRAPRGGDIQMGLNSIDKLRLAADALIAGSRPAKGVAPLTGIRELYIRLSGDYDMTGMFHGERVELASVDSSTMAALVADALNKRVGVLFAEYPHWWEPIVVEEDFTTLQSAKWITLGGVGVLPTVVEGAAYQELTWDDKTEETAFVKKGGYLGITIEAIDKDDTRKIQAAPRALAQAAWLTLGATVSAIFTAQSGTGPTLGTDSKALFHTDHANLGTTALSATEYAVVRLAMRKQAELNSSVALGALTAPKYILVPPDLETAALTALATEATVVYAGGVPTSISENIFAEGDFHDARMDAARRRVIVVDLWTDAGDWAAVADPRLYPSIGIGYRYGRVPEIFSVASPTAGLMFTNDTMPVKVRYFFSVGVIDYRGLYKENVG